MNVNKERLRYLLHAYIADRMDGHEFKELKSYVSRMGSDDELHTLIDELWSTIDTERPLSISSDLIYRRIQHDPRVLGSSGEVARSANVFIRYSWQWVTGIAALLCVAAGLFMYRGLDNQPIDVTATDAVTPPILPGDNKAMLTLADGRVISLDEAARGDLAEQAGVRIVKTKDGQLSYEPINKSVGEEVIYNTVSTPKGGEYQLVLPDGTKVWLNAASSLRYPVRFTGDQRKVELVGEAYFEVTPVEASNAKLPFIVATTQQQVEVLGTHFNIKAYANEDETKTTLLEGSVRVSIPARGAFDVLKPNEQAIIKSGGKRIAVTTVDPSSAIAWKNGIFAFHDNTIVEIMNTIARWYDVTVEYEGGMPPKDKIFGGTISKFESFEKLLETIELTGTVKFKIAGRRVIVMT